MNGGLHHSADAICGIEQIPDGIFEFYSSFSSTDTVVTPLGRLWPSPYVVALYAADSEKSPSDQVEVIEWIKRYPFYGELSNYEDSHLCAFFDAPSLPAFVRYTNEPLMMASVTNLLSHFAYKLGDPYESGKVLNVLSPESVPLAELLFALFQKP